MPLKKQYHSTLTKTVKVFDYVAYARDLMTHARWAVVGRNKQLDEGAGRQSWKCLDPLNCVAPVAF